MAVASTKKRSTRRRSSSPREIPPLVRRYLPAWFILIAVLVVLLPNMLAVTADAGGRVLRAIPVWVGQLFARPSSIAPLFRPEVQHWAEDIGRWAEEHDLDPNLLATLMQIESCGHPTVSSSAGAQGLFQVMPFHFETGEDQLDPDTNADNSADVIHECLRFANGDTGLAMACYNGGPSVTRKPFDQWPNQTQRFYYWGTGIYTAASENQSSSSRLSEWLNAGGAQLCQMAEAELGLG
jgi:hypothetical protein